jgi:hypothetical protein
MGRLKLRHGDNEIEVEGTDEFIRKQVDSFYERLSGKLAQAGGTVKQRLMEPAGAVSPGKKPTAAEFYRDKGKTDGISQILILGKYLEQYHNVAEFTMKDINEIAKKDVKLSKDIHGQYFTNAVKQGLLRKHGQKYSLTLSAEEILTTMRAGK